MSLCIQLHLHYVEISLSLIELIADSINLMLLLLHLDAMSALDVLLDLHPHDISVHW